LWKWKENSRVHREKFVKLREFGKTHPKEIKEVNGVRFCCLEEFLIGKGNDGTRVYVGLGKDGYERAVKCLRRDACAGLAEHEKEILNEPKAKKSNHVANYCSFDWIAVESHPLNPIIFRTGDATVCYKKESDIQVGIFLR
jgi:hypothetical protein